MVWIVDGIGYLAATLTTAAFAPQVVKSWRSRSVRDLSVAMLVAMCLGTACWFAYGVATGAGPLMLANAVTFLLVGALAALKLRESAASRTPPAQPGSSGQDALGPAEMALPRP